MWLVSLDSRLDSRLDATQIREFGTSQSLW